MKQVIMALIVSGLTWYSADAQTVKVCGVKKDKVCRLKGNKVSCYKTNYAENFKVCKNENGYFICCETPNRYNSTHPNPVIVQRKRLPNYIYQDQGTAVATTTTVDMSLPQSQSYTVTNNNSYEGYYPVRGRIKVCYTGDNVAELNRAPYEGCPSPASEGPEVNRQRNINVSNPQPMPPLAGQPY